MKPYPIFFAALIATTDAQGAPVEFSGTYPHLAFFNDENEVGEGVPSAPYLMTGYDRKSLVLTTSQPTKIVAEIDITGRGDWHTYRTFEVDDTVSHEFPRSFQAYWIRFVSTHATHATTATAQLTSR